MTSSVIGFLAPLVVVSRKCDNQKGSLMFQASAPVLLRL